MVGIRSSLALSLVATLGCACGGSGGYGGGGGGGSPQIYTVDLAADLVNTGTTTPATVAAGQPFGPGDFANNVEARGQVRFPFAGIPGNATITVAVLRMTQSAVSGTPYNEIGTVDVDAIDQGPGLDLADHASAALVTNVGALSSDATLGLKTLVVTAAVQANFGVRPANDFRLRFTTAPSLDGNPDRAFFQALAQGEEMVLRVTYTLP